MAKRAVRCAITKVVEDSNMDMQSPRIEHFKRLASQLLQKVDDDDDAAMTAFDKFSYDITSKLESICQSCSKYKSFSVKKTNMWRVFHTARVEELPKLWKHLFTSLHMDAADQLLEQSVNQRVFEMILPQHITSDKTESTSSDEDKDEEVVVTKDELNALQYVGGYVPHCLLKRFEKNKRYTKFLECLGDMAVTSESDGDVFDYTKEWIEKVNRGGLFPLNNITFQLFVEIEKATRVSLRCYLIDSHDQVLKDIIESIAINDEVQWCWTLISQSIQSVEDSDWLLREIVKLYVTVRGFSMAANWLEHYKKEAKKSTKKTTGLRKHLS